MTKLILPTPSQAEWAEREIGVIIHLDLPVFSDDVHYNFRDHYGDPLPAARPRRGRAGRATWCANL